MRPFWRSHLASPLLRNWSKITCNAGLLGHVQPTQQPGRGMVLILMTEPMLPWGRLRQHKDLTTQCLDSRLVRSCSSSSSFVDARQACSARASIRQGGGCSSQATCYLAGGQPALVLQQEAAQGDMVTGCCSTVQLPLPHYTAGGQPEPVLQQGATRNHALADCCAVHMCAMHSSQQVHDTKQPPAAALMQQQPALSRGQRAEPHRAELIQSTLASLAKSPKCVSKSTRESGLSRA